MNDDITGVLSKSKSTTDWELLRSLSDEEIRTGIEADPENLPTDESFWKDAKIVLPTPKETITIRLDADILAWFRQEKGYQTKINAVLRAYVKAQS